MVDNMFFVYENLTKPLCVEMGLPQTAYDILLFVYNHPDFATAKDIYSIRKIKPSLLSFHIDRLVADGYLIRKNVEGDRRKVQLICTDKANKYMQKGAHLQCKYGQLMTEGLTKEQLDTFKECLMCIDKNAKKFSSQKD